MRVLAATMRQGAYLTPKLFVPRDVWYVQSSKATRPRQCSPHAC